MTVDEKRFQVSPAGSNGPGKWVWRLLGRHDERLERRYRGWQLGGLSKAEATRRALAALKEEKHER